jgi:hypothetical protein
MTRAQAFPGVVFVTARKSTSKVSTNRMLWNCNTSIFNRL